jgi:hypothetical protein
MAARLPHVGVDVDGLSCSLQHPTTYNRQTRGHAYYQALPCLIKLEWAVALFLGDAMSPGLDIYWSVDHLGTCATKLYMDYVFFPGHVHPMSEALWYLCVYPWSNHYSRY